MRATCTPDRFRLLRGRVRGRLYNGFEQLIRRVITNSGAANGTTHFVHDQWGNVIAELNATGATVREYIYLPEAEISPTRQSRTQLDIPVAVVDAVNTATPVLLMVHVDQLGRPIRMTDSLKASVWDVQYTPWGAPHAITGAQTLNARFPGQWFQLESSLAYNWHRHYDASIGRYTQPDPLGFVDGPSVYAYARNSVLRYVDPDGRNVCVVPGLCPYIIKKTVEMCATVATAVILNMATKKETKRCQKVRKACYDQCEGAVSGPRSDQGNRFIRCVNQCLYDNNCGGVDYSND